MSRQIPNDHPWSPEEIEYQLARGRTRAVEKNHNDFPPGSESTASVEDSEPKIDPDIFESVNGLELDQLKSELLKRELPVKGDRVALKVALAQTLQSERNSLTK